MDIYLTGKNSKGKNQKKRCIKKTRTDKKRKNVLPKPVVSPSTGQT
jgi:hypothetical protein